MKLLNSIKLSLLPILALPIILSSCQKLDSLIKVNIPLQMADVSFTIPATSGTTVSTGATIEFNVDSAIQANNASFTAANIKSVIVDSVIVNLTNATAGNSFSNVSSFSASVSSNTDATQVVFAQANNNTTGVVSTLKLIPTSNVDLVYYFNSTSFTYAFNATLVTPTTIDLTADATIYYHAVVSPD